MEKLNTKKKILLLALILSGYFGYNYQYRSDYEILPNENEAYALCDDMAIYIGNQKYLENIKNNNENAILVLDERFTDDPNMVIYNSCSIKDKDIRNNILEVLCEYEEENPSSWDRSIESMRMEWFMHNLGYYFNYRVDHTADVDLNNDDENKYDKKVLHMLLKI